MLFTSTRSRFALLGTLALTAASAHAQTDLIISQYYEGASNHKFVELHNPTANPISLNGYALTVWSNAGREAWKTDGATLTGTSAILALPNITLNAGSYYLIANSSALKPVYAKSAANLNTTLATGFNGDDSLVLYKQTTSPFSHANLVDALCFTGNTGGDKSIRRAIYDQIGYSLALGTNSLSLTGVWEETPTVLSPSTNDDNNVVAVAAAGDTWRLESSLAGTPPVLAAFSIAGDAATTVTPKVTLPFTFSGDNPTEFMVGVDSDFTGASWQTYTGTTPRTLLATPPGPSTLYFKIRNSSGESVPLSDTIDYQPITTPPTVLFTQYYEGNGNNKFLEITNLTDTAIDLTGWRLGRWTNQDAELWAYAGLTIGGSSNSISLSALGSLGGRQSVVIGNTSAALANVTPQLLNGEISFSGNDSLGLYSGTVSPTTLVDMINFTELGNEGLDTSFKRISTSSGYDFATGATVNTFTTVWETLPIATVDAAGAGTDANHLGTYFISTTGYDAWAAEKFSGSVDPLVIGFNADPDGDRVPNGLEHILVTDPNASSETFKTLAAPAAGTFVGVHRKIRGITDVQVGYQWSTDLSEWRFSSEANAAGDIISISTSTVLDTLTYQEVEVTGTVLNGTPSKVFLRIIAAK